MSLAITDSSLCKVIFTVSTTALIGLIIDIAQRRNWFVPISHFINEYPFCWCCGLFGFVVAIFKYVLFKN
jgi:hypothetical protein